MRSTFLSSTQGDINQAVKNNDWDKVNKLYHGASCDDRTNLESTIYNAVIGKLPAIKDEQLTAYLLRVMSLMPVLIKARLCDFLNNSPQYKSHSTYLGKSIAEVSADIFTVMLMNNCGYDNALKHVDEQKAIPSIAPVIELLKELCPSKK